MIVSSIFSRLKPEEKSQSDDKFYSITSLSMGLKERRSC